MEVVKVTGTEPFAGQVDYWPSVDALIAEWLKLAAMGPEYGPPRPPPPKRKPKVVTRWKGRGRDWWDD